MEVGGWRSTSTDLQKHTTMEAHGEEWLFTVSPDEQSDERSTACVVCPPHPHSPLLFLFAIIWLFLIIILR